MTAKTNEENFLEDAPSFRELNHSFQARITNLRPPQSYLDKMNVFEKNPLLNCFANQKEINLTRDNLKLFYSLVTEADVPFNAENNEHLKILADVFKLSFKAEPANATELLDNQLWKDFGFQTAKPGTDFRGGGLLSLKAMRFMADKDPKLVEDAREFMRTNDSYLHACVVITVVFQLKNFLHFGLYTAYHQSYDLEKACSRRCLKFILDMEDGQKLDAFLRGFFKLVCAVTRRVMGFWKKSCELDPRIRIIDFKQAETIVFKVVQSVLEVEAEKKKVPSYTMDRLSEQVLCAKISEHVVPMLPG